MACRIFNSSKSWFRWLAAKVGQNQNQLRDSEVEILDMWWCWYYVSMDFGSNIDGDIVSVFLKKVIMTICQMFLIITRSLPWSD